MSATKDKSVDTVQDTSQESDADHLLRRKDFGSALAKARNSLSLSVTEVSDKLLVSVDIIKAIENSQADNLPALTFTKGYIRNYARLVGISADEIISAYLSVAPEQNSSLSSRAGLPSQASSNHFFIKFISVLFVFSAFTVLFYWFYQTDFALQKQDAGPSANLSETAPERLQIRQQTEVETSVVASPEADKSDSDTAQPSTQSLEVDSSLQSALLPNKSETDQPVVNRVNETLPLTDQAAATEHNEPPGATPTNSNGAIAGTLLLKASESSWVEIKDSTGKKLFYQLLNAGEEINLQGKPPYSVFLGNARKVRIEINQQNIVFDHLMSGQRKTVSLNIKADAQVKLNTRR